MSSGLSYDLSVGVAKNSLLGRDYFICGVVFELAEVMGDLLPWASSRLTAKALRLLSLVLRPGDFPSLLRDRDLLFSFCWMLGGWGSVFSVAKIFHKLSR